jgi:hypothetical protein
VKTKRQGLPDQENRVEFPVVVDTLADETLEIFG